LIAAAIFFGLVDGCPLPPEDATPEWERGIVDAVRKVQHVVERPVAWIGPSLRVSQWWALYQNPAGRRYRLWIEGQDPAGAWRILFRAADPDHDEDAEVLEPSRMWGAYDRIDGTAPNYGGFCHWITSRMLDRHPDLVTMRVRLEEVMIVRGGFEPTGRFVDNCVRPRGIP
jgi:hypothetical protein